MSDAPDVLTMAFEDFQFFGSLKLYEENCNELGMQCNKLVNFGVRGALK